MLFKIEKKILEGATASHLYYYFDAHCAKMQKVNENLIFHS